MQLYICSLLLASYMDRKGCKVWSHAQLTRNWLNSSQLTIDQKREQWIGNISEGSIVWKHKTDDFAQGGKNYIKRKDKRESPRADNFVFRLHYQFTFGILVTVLNCNCCNGIDSNANGSRQVIRKVRIRKLGLVGCILISKSLSFSVGGNDACGRAKLH